MHNDSMRIFIKYNSKVCSVGRFDLLPAKGDRSPRVVWVYNFVPVHGTFWRSKHGFRDKFRKEKYFKESFEANWTISFKIRANIDG